MNFSIVVAAAFLWAGVGWSHGADREESSLAYNFQKGTTTRYRVSIVSDTHTLKAVSGVAGITEVLQKSSQEMVIEETVKEVDLTGTAELVITFKEAKMEVSVKMGAKKEPQPPDTLKYFAGRSVTAYIMADGTVHGVNAVSSLVAAAKEAAKGKEPALVELIEQTYGEEFFKELLQNLHPQFPLDATLARQGWDVITDIPVPRTAYKLRVTTKSSLGRTENGVARISRKGTVKALPMDPDKPVNPSAPVVEVLASTITGDEDFSFEKGVIVSSDTINKLDLRTTMRMRPPGGRGNEFRTEVVTKNSTRTSVRLEK